MKICQIVFEAPNSPLSGANIRNLALSHAISMLGKGTVFHVQSYGPNLSWHPARARSFIAAAFSAEMVDCIVIDVMAKKPDVVIVEGVYLAALAEALLAKDLPVILDMHNVESALRQQIDRQKGSSLKRKLAPWRYRGRWLRALEHEAQLAQAVNAVWVCSPNDAAHLKQIAPHVRQIDIVPNPAPQVNACHQRIKGRSPNAVFVGHLGYEPNVHAVHELVDDIFPIVLKDTPGATLTIAGRAPHRSIVAAVQSKKNVQLIASPPDLHDIYARANVALIPLRSGGGTRLKALEAMACGLPVIATQKAVEGLNLTAGQHYLRAESAQGFADHIRSLTADPQLRDGLTQAACKFVQEHHSEAALITAIQRSLEKMA